MPNGFSNKFLLIYYCWKEHNQKTNKQTVKCCGIPEKKRLHPRGNRDGCAEKVTITVGFERGVCFVLWTEERAVQVGTHKRTAIQKRMTLTFKAAKGRQAGK